LNVTDAIIHFIGDGSALSHLNASNVDFGTLSTSVFPASGVTVGTYGSSANVAQVTIDTYGRVTSATNVAITSSQWTGTPGNPIYYIPGVGVGSSIPATANLQVTGNVYVSNAITTTNVFAATEILTGTTDQTTLNVTGNVYVSNAVTTMNVFANIYYGDGGLLSNVGSQWTGNKGSPIYYIPGVGVGSSIPATANLQVTGNVYVSNAVTTTNVFATRYYGDGGLLSNISSDAITQPFANLVVSNSVTTTNVFATRYYGDGGLLSNISSDAITQPFANLVVSNSVTTTNVFATSANIATMNVSYLTADSAIVYGSSLNVYGTSNLTNVTVTDTFNVNGSMTANAANATFFFDTFTIPYINTQELNVASNIVLTGNLSAPLANITTLNVNYLTVNSAVVYGTSTLNVYGVSNLSTATMVGSTGQTTLNVTGNIYASNALTTTDVFATTANIATTNTQTLTVTSNMNFTGPLATFANLYVPGNTNMEYLSVSNLSVTGNLYVTATNVQTTNALTINNSGTMTALKVTQNETSIHTHNVAEFWDATTLAMVIDPEGNVAIHTTSSPGYALTVTDPANFETLYIRGKPGTTSLDVIGTVTATTFSGSGASLTSLPMGQASGTLAAGNGGTGQSTYVLGDLLYASGTTAISKLSGSVSATTAFLSQTGTGTVSAAPVWTTSTGTGSVVLSASPTLTGTTNVTTLIASGNITSSSDRRIKTDIKRIEGALDKVTQIGGYTFIRTDEPNKDMRQAGIIAQEIIKVLPEVVQISEETGYYSVSYGNITALLIEALKEERIERLKLEERLARLEN
jgi:hypothetical protein